ncbi:MAG: ribosomal-protein-alanine N-acetyltransferase [Alphaproteobacteria bacterium]|nr:ribosomal-protein-alanine N-acetyltransferase [Alphaproteobacteria bacterium]
MISLIPLTPNDDSTLESIHVACLPNSWSQTAFKELLNEQHTFGWMALSQEEGPVGFILARVLRREAEILTFAVFPSFQRKGIGRSLLSKLFAHLASIRCLTVFLEVAENNEHAYKLYQSFGFTQVGTRPDYYQQEDKSFISARVMMGHIRLK